MNQYIKRESNFELLRILSICLIIAFHYVLKGKLSFESDTSFNKLLCDTCNYFGELGVNCFVLISGYFLSKSKSMFKLKKVLLFSLQVLFYMVLSQVILFAVKSPDSNIFSFRSYAFPLLTNRFWFISAYVILYIISPYLNIVIDSINKKQFQFLLLSQIIIWSVFPTIAYGAIDKNPESSSLYSRFIWLVVVYIIGAYIRKYDLIFLNSVKRCLILFLSVLSILILYIVCCNFEILPAFVSNKYSSVYFATPNSIIELLLSVSLFGVFSYIKVPNKSVINYIASCTLGVYMLHDGELYKFIWYDIFKNANYSNSHLLILHILSAVLIILMAGIITESIRKPIEKFVGKLIDLIYDKALHFLHVKK